jgi:CRP-like cAMP-binding protein
LGRLFLAAAGVGGVFIACAGAASNVLIVIPSIVFFGAGLAGSLALGSTLIERFVPDELIGRVLGLFEAMMFCAEAVGAGLAPSLVSAIGMRATMFAAGGSLIVVLAMTLVAICRMDAQEGKASWMLDVLAQAKFLTALPLARYEQLARNAVQRDLSPGESACRQGEFGDQFYVIVSGEFEVLVDGERVRTLGPGDSFGDIALLRRIPRTATVTALDSARVVTVRRRAFLEAVTGRRSVAMYDDGELALPERRAWDPSPFLTREEASLDEQARSLTAIPLLSRLSPDAACELARHAEVIEAPAGTRLIEQGEEGDAYYVIATGEVFFSENGEIVVTLGPGHGFGELALLRNEPRAASAFTKTWATLVRFPAQSFLRALRPAEND